ncbi:MAG: DNA-processing protein DprA [Phycisphaerales bacterium]|nr:DNA-processing protein DprA [Phycisphaerales bacterium]
MKREEATYWIALAHLPRWGYLKINNLIIKFFHENKISIEDFFQLSEQEWHHQYQLDEKQVADLKQAKSELASHAFLAESFFSQGFEIIPITSPDYSKTLKSNLKAAHAPAVLYIKGNKQLLQEKSIAIVGSRDASEIALTCTDNIAKLASKEYKVVVSGFARGVDKQALDSAIKYKGQSVIVLPQGIMTFSSGFKDYYKQIIDGDVLVLSTFFPKTPWKVELAMARNAIIYGLANEIYVAESADKGGTWSGVLDGLKKNRIIYVRQSDPTEKNANNILIQKGAIPVDFNGVVLSSPATVTHNDKCYTSEELKNNKALDEAMIYTILQNDRILTGAEIFKIMKLSPPWTPPKLSHYLKKLDSIEVVKKKNTNAYKLKGTTNKQVTKINFSN